MSNIRFSAIATPFIQRASYIYHNVKQKLGLESAAAMALKEKLNAFSMAQFSSKAEIVTNPSKENLTPLHEAIASLSTQPNAALEQALIHKLEEADTKQFKRALKSICIYSFTENQLKMFDVCQKIVTLEKLQEATNRTDILSSAKKDAEIVPIPESHKTISKSFFHNWISNSQTLNRIFQYFITTLTWSYGIDLDNPPRVRWAAQSQMTFFRTMFRDIIWISTVVMQFFPSTRKVMLFAGAILGSIIGVSCLYYYFRFRTPTFNKELFRNLNEMAQLGLLNKTIGRTLEKENLTVAMSSPQGARTLMALLKGPSGVGKSQVVEGLAIDIVQGNIPALKGVTILAVNMASLADPGNWHETGYSSRLDILFKELEKHKDRVIVFFDEAHNAATAQGKRPSILEQLKTKLENTKIRVILATTEAEYQEHIQTNQPFDHRIVHIQLETLDAHSIMDILIQKGVIDNNSSIPVTLEGLYAIMEKARTLPDYQGRFSPRKELLLLQLITNYVRSWTPNLLKQELKWLNREKKLIEIECKELRDHSNWDVTVQGQEAYDRLKKVMKAIADKEKDLFHQTKDRQKIFDLLELRSLYGKQEHEVIHFLAREESNKLNAEAAKTYLFLKFFLLHQLEKKIEKTATIFYRAYGESIPLKVNESVVRDYFGDPILRKSSVRYSTAPTRAFSLLSSPTDNHSAAQNLSFSSLTNATNEWKSNKIPRAYSFDSFFFTTAPSSAQSKPTVQVSPFPSLQDNQPVPDSKIDELSFSRVTRLPSIRILPAFSTEGIEEQMPATEPDDQATPRSVAERVSPYPNSVLAKRAKHLANLEALDRLSRISSPRTPHRSDLQPLIDTESTLTASAQMAALSPRPRSSPRITPRPSLEEGKTSFMTASTPI